MEANTTFSFSKNQATLLMVQNCITWDDLQILSLEEWVRGCQAVPILFPPHVSPPWLSIWVKLMYSNQPPGKKNNIEGANRPTDLKLIQSQMAQQNFKMQNHCEYLLYCCKDCTNEKVEGTYRILTETQTTGLVITLSKLKQIWVKVVVLLHHCHHS